MRVYKFADLKVGDKFVVWPVIEGMPYTPSPFEGEDLTLLEKVDNDRYKICSDGRLIPTVSSFLPCVKVET